MGDTKKITIKERKKAQPNAVLYFSEQEKTSIVNTVAKGLTEPQVGVFFYTCQALGLNPLLNEICAIPYAGKMSIQVMRDGFLTIAHRSGKFAGIESGVTVSEDGKLINGWAKVYHKDFSQPVYQEADFDEYNSDRNPLWKSKPKTMIKKVAESMALRKAFNVSGVYSPEEMDKEMIVAKEVPSASDDNEPATEAQITTIRAMGGTIEDEGALTRGIAKKMISELANKK